MKDSLLIILPIIIFILVIQGVTIFLAWRFLIGGVRRGAEAIRQFMNDANEKMDEIKSDVERLQDQIQPAVDCGGGCTCEEESVEGSEGRKNAKPFDFLNNSDPALFLGVIQHEYPQTIALVLSHMEPAKASLILQYLPDEVQSDVLRRIACMDRANPDMVSAVERVLKQHLSTVRDYDYTGGVECAVEIINLVDRTCESKIIEAIEKDDPELAGEIKKRMFVFEDIVMLDDRAIQRVMREVDTQELAKALKGTTDEVKDKIFRNMSQRAAAMLREDMEYMGPVRLSDVQEAQNKIVSIIKHLEETGEIVSIRVGDGELVD